MDDIDRKILNRIQSDFPVTSRPYLVVANNLGLSEDDVLKRLARLKEKRIIRRIGGNFVPEKLGFVSTLCAAKVPEDKIEFFAKEVNGYPGVTHNYKRDNKYNICPFSSFSAMPARMTIFSSDARFKSLSVAGPGTGSAASNISVRTL